MGNPLNASTGNKYEQEVDYHWSGAFPMAFARHYNSAGYGSGSIGKRWSHSFQRQVIRQSTTRAKLIRDDDEIIYFDHCSSGWCAPPDVAGKLTELTNSSGGTTGWRYIDENDVTEVYDGGGRMLSERSRAGVEHLLSYDTASRLSTVKDSFGHQIGLTYDSSARVRELTLPDSNVVLFDYDVAGNLISATYPGNQVRTYLYDESPFVAAGAVASLLTGIQDESLQRYATFQYNAQSQIIDEHHGASADRLQITYNPNGTTTVQDAAGTSRTFTWQTLANVNHIASVAGPVCSTCNLSASYTYTPNGLVESSTDFNGNETRYGYDLARNLMTSRTEAYGTPRARTIATAWNGTWRVPDLLTESNRTTGFTYDTSGNALTRTITDTTVTPNVERTWEYTYDSFGRVLSEDGSRSDVNDVTTYTYYSCTTGYQCGQVHTITNALAQVTTFNTYNAHGHPLTITDPNGIVTTLSYDLRQRLTSRQVGTETTTFTYWPTGLLKKVTLPDSSFLQYTYDNAHRLTKIEDSEGNRLDYTLDAMGNRTAENVYDPSSALSRTRTQVFNSLNQLWKQVGAAGTAAVTTTFGYDANGNRASIDAPLSRTTANEYDELNRLEEITDPASGITQFGYDANDNLTSVTDPRTLVTSYSYSGFDELKQQVSPDTGAINNTYDARGNLKTSTDARGAITTYIYDELDRVTSAAFKIGSTTDQTISYTYDAGTNGLGRLTGASDSSHSMSWQYDALGRVSGKGQTVGTVTRSVAYGYTDGNQTSLTTPSGQSVAYGYTNGQITSIAINGTTLLSGVLYEPFGPVRLWTWGNGSLTARTYDDDGRITVVDSKHVFGYGYDDASRITNSTNSGLANFDWIYGYDGLDRITSAARTGESLGWSYDANGNRLSQTSSATDTYTISGTSNRLSGISGGVSRTYGYDTAGNTTSYSNIVFAYNNRGRMKSATVGGVATNYVYNALGQLVKKSGGGGTTLFMYDEAGHLLGEYTSTGTLVQETIWMGDIPVATLRPKTGGGIDIFYVHTDHQNTPRRVTRPSDNKMRWRWDTNPFTDGAVSQNPENLSTFVYNLRLPGQMHMAETGLRYNYFRDYDPYAGRYVQSDPIGLEGGINTYAYALANPLRYTDATGENAVAVGRAVVQPIGLGLAAGLACALHPDLCRGVISAMCEDLGEILDSLANPLLIRLPLDAGGAEWGRRNGVGAREGRNRAHEIKKRDNMSRPTDKYTVDPDTGDVYDPEGEHIGNLNEPY